MYTRARMDTILHTGPEGAAHAVHLYRHGDNEWQLFIGTNGHAPRYCERMTSNQLIRLLMTALTLVITDGDD